jgi:hypothetical protein
VASSNFASAITFKNLSVNLGLVPPVITTQPASVSTVEFNTVVLTAAGLRLVDWALRASAGPLGYAGFDDPAALPLVLLVLTAFGLLLMPAQNALSRLFERQCDRYALARTGHADAYRSAFTKLARLNKADPDPHPLVVWLLYDHPPIRERLEMAGPSHHPLLRQASTGTAGGVAGALLANAMFERPILETATHVRTGAARNAPAPKRSMSNRDAPVAIISIAQHARPKVIGQSDDRRAQLKSLVIPRVFIKRATR